MDGKIKDWASEAKIIKWILRKKLRLHLETTPVIFAEENTATDEEHKLIIQNAVCRREWRSVIHRKGLIIPLSSFIFFLLQFEVLNLPSICIVPAAVLALLAAGRYC